MKKKKLLTLILVSILTFSYSINAFGVVKVKEGNYQTTTDTKEAQGDGKGTNTWYYDGISDNESGDTLLVGGHSGQSGKGYEGEDFTEKTQGYVVGNNDVEGDIREALEKKGLNADEELAKRGITFDEKGRAIGPDGKLLAEIYLGPGSESIQKPEHIHSWTTSKVGSNWSLDSVRRSGTDTKITYDEIDRVRTGDKNIINVNSYLYGPGASGYGNTSGWSRAWQQPYYVELNAVYTAHWKHYTKYQRSCDCGASYSWIDCDGSTSQTKIVSYKANIHKPYYEECAPLDLTTERAYTGPMKIINQHGHLSPELRSPDSKITDSLPITVDKTSFKADEFLSLTSTNEPVEFTLDFKNTWYGVGDNYNLDGNATNGLYNNAENDGYQWVRWAEMWYGGDYIQDDRPEKINSITKFDNDREESVLSEKVYTDSPGTAQLGKYNFLLRSIKPNEEPYNIGEAGNDVWITYFEICRNNLRGVDWKASCSSNPGSLSASKTKEDYTKYVIWNKFMQPVLYGEYEVHTPAAR